jgi:YggT family protein
VDLFLCDLTKTLSWLVNVYTLLLFVYAVFSWIPDLRRSRWSYYLSRIIEPVLTPVRRIIPPVGGFDVAFLIVLLVLQLLVRPVLTTATFNSCIPLY